MVYNREFVERSYDTRLPGIFTLGQGNRAALQRIEECRTAIETLEQDIDNRKHTLGGADGGGGKLGELATLRARLEEDCWALKTRHDAYFHDAFTGYMGAKSAFCDKVLEEKNSNSAAAIDLEQLKTRVATVFEKGLQTERLLATLPVDLLDAHEAAPLLAKRVIGKEDVDVAALIRKLGNSDWVKQGLSYLPHSEGDCPFCQQNLPHDIDERLAEYFDETYARDIEAINRLIGDYRASSSNVLESVGRLLADKPRYLDTDAVKALQEHLKERVEANQRKLDLKTKEPSSTVSLEPTRPLLAQLSGLIGTANEKAEGQNRLLANLVAERETVVSQVWRCVIDEAEPALARFDADRRNVDAAIVGLQSSIDQKQGEATALNSEMNALERCITSVEPTVIEINKILTSFGFRGFRLTAAEGEKSQYQIVRPDGADATRTLSEGEKTFITFLYFYHLLRGSSSESGITSDRIVVIDDPVSSLDSDILFVVSSLIKRLLKEACDGNGLIKQVILLTHNIYFHKEVTFDPRRQKVCMNHETFWIVKKRDDVSVLESHAGNPIQTSYQLLWNEVRDPQRSKLTIQNTLRRILENYFKILGEIELDKVVDRFEGQEKMICGALLSWAHDGSHNAHDDLYLTSDEETIARYLSVFRKIFELSGQSSHYKMMMKVEADELEAGPAEPMLTAIPTEGAA